MEWGTYSMAPFSNRAFISCSITRTCWGATLVENTPINLGGRDPNCIDIVNFFYSLQDPTRYIWLKIPGCQNSTWGTSLSRLVSGFICSCAVRATSWNGEPTGSIWTDHSETLLGGGGHPKATMFPGGPWYMRSPETAAPWSTRGGRVCRTVLWGQWRETDNVSPRASGLFPAAFLKIITDFKSILHLEGCGWARFPCPHYLGGEAR